MAPLTPLSNPPELVLYHDPASSTSEYALQALQLGCQPLQVRHVNLPGTALTEPELRDLASRLQGDEVDALVRRGATYRSLGLDLGGADTDTVVATLVEHPNLLVAPILDDGHHTMIGRPRERAEAWAVTGRVVPATPEFAHAA